MEKSQVLAALISEHTQVQQKGGYSADQVVPDACPLSDLPGFKSLLIPRVLRAVARTLGIVIPKGQLRNIYVSKDRERRKLSLSEVAENFCQRYASTKEATLAGTAG